MTVASSNQKKETKQSENDGPQNEILLKALHAQSEPFNDGYVPPLFKLKNVSTSRIVRQRRKAFFLESDAERCARVNVLDEVFPSQLVNEIYREVSMSIHAPPAWGTYVPLDRKQEYRADESLRSGNARLHELAESAVNYLMKSIHELNNDYNAVADQVHGVGVWCLVSSDDKGSSKGVAYHIDYAEGVRYEHNIIVPPIFGAVLHCTDTSIVKMVGGDFLIHTGGLEHYKKHGYKQGKKIDEEGMSYAGGSSKVQDCDESRIGKNNWMKIPYRYNRVILFDGEYPHMSTKVTFLSSPTKNKRASPAKRVIMGFNFFSNDVGLLVQRAPEHSPAFYEKVKKLNQLYVSSKRSSDESRLISFDSIKSTAGLAKMLVLAKRRRVKQILQEERNKIRSAAIQILVAEQILHGQAKISVESLIEKISEVCDGIRKEDIHVHLKFISFESNQNYYVRIQSKGIGGKCDEKDLLPLDFICTLIASFDAN